MSTDWWTVSKDARSSARTCRQPLRGDGCRLGRTCIACLAREGAEGGRGRMEPTEERGAAGAARQPLVPSHERAHTRKGSLTRFCPVQFAFPGRVVRHETHRRCRSVADLREREPAMFTGAEAQKRHDSCRIMVQPACLKIPAHAPPHPETLPPVSAPRVTNVNSLAPAESLCRTEMTAPLDGPGILADGETCGGVAQPNLATTPHHKTRAQSLLLGFKDGGERPFIGHLSPNKYGRKWYGRLDTCCLAAGVCAHVCLCV